ncbi:MULTISPECIES: type VII secretion target [unclassified Amycolatopsis]|uniref:type VII secretion target n=1 Tax=unclassified Amycolatopsis TaxID=2618356 RepID=UPI001C699C21|nr:type VII secretion target [Amycolatopsis sp. DSM 110486]QYN21556.1 ESX-1 secretion-associated protein [Amycolatopsis sp. DSM 110486]
MAGTQQVNLTALQTHKGEVQDIGAGVKTAAEATVEGQAMSDDAFGIVGSPFGAAMELWTATASIFINGVADSAEDIADKLQQAHDAYDTHETNSKNTINTLGKELPE